MNAFLNYFVEANLALCLMLLMYVLFLNGETDFNVKRIFLLTSIAASLLFPLVQISGPQSSYLPSLMQVVPITWLPEVVVTADGQPLVTNRNNSFNWWSVIESIYMAGTTVALVLFLVRLFMVVRTLIPHRSYRLGKYFVFESDENTSSFSFFRCIYVGQATQLSVSERTMIIQHEQIHSRRLHSFDILLINIIGVFFWFNPVIGIYKKIFVQLHEFEADARSVSPGEVDNYCSLLAKVALLSADMKLANHFSNSLTVKRIEMMRTIKAKIKRWKYVALAMVLPSIFFVVACQEQVASEMTEIAKNSSNALLVPDNVQARYDEIKKTNPTGKVLLLDLNSEAITRLQNLEAAYGKPKSLEIFEPDGTVKQATYASTMITKANGIQFQQNTDDKHWYAILEYSDAVSQILENAKSDDLVYPAVEEQAEFPGGLPALVNFLSENLRYPGVARQQGIEGVVYVNFVVEKDGSVTSVEPIKSLSPETDAEAIRVVESFPKWTPGKKDGKTVRSSFVIPIKYKLSS